MRRAARFINNDSLKEMNNVDTTKTHKIYVNTSYAAQFLQNATNVSVTENGAVGYKTSTHLLLDLNFMVSSLRGMDERYIVNRFIPAFYEDKKYAVKWLFFLRDILEGMGERRTFRICLKYLAVSHPAIALSVMKLVPEYGRYDDLLVYLDTPLCGEAAAFIKEQLKKDEVAMAEGKAVSLLAKWLPGNNTSSAESRRYAHILEKELGLSAKEYRKLLAALRGHMAVVEQKLSANQWDRVAYEALPAKAQLKYDKAFSRHDKERRSAYLKEVFLGEGKLNAKGLMPYEIVGRLVKGNGWWYENALQDDLLAELMWQKISEEGFQNDWGLEDCIVVADGSGSMCSAVSGSNSIRALDVCNSLAIYFAEQLKGVFHNKAITFSETPQFIDLAPGESLKEKLEIMLAHNEVANTNIEAVFRLLLEMAVSGQVPAEELPKQVLIISDMEFDMAQGYSSWRRVEGMQHFDEALFAQIAERYKSAGYTMPRLIFWNVCGRTNTIPMVDNESGICLLSGFSQNAMKVAAQKEKKDPYVSLLQLLDSPRYDRVEEALKSA